MPIELEIGFTPESLSEGTPEEKAAFGIFTILTANGSLTEGYDEFLGGSRLGPLVSAYHAAEWFAWNWWRLRWEPRRNSDDWVLAHRLNSIGEGYVWPDITIFSDGERTALLSAPSSNPEARPFRYFGGHPSIVRSQTWEVALDAFIGQVIAQLAAKDLRESNLNRIWTDILAERADPEIAKRRKLEALLGRDPDAVDDDRVERLVGEEQELGRSAIEEVAADLEGAGNRAVFSARQFKNIARTAGFDADLRDAVRLDAIEVAHRGELPAWRLGSQAAKKLREQERLGWDKITDHRLAAMAGCTRQALNRNREANQPLSFSLAENGARAKIVLRSKWNSGRRFEFARLIGDAIFGEPGKFHPATRAYTYRQKAQRSFAAELLCPFQTLDDMLDGDYSQEALQDAAEYFAVSPMTVSTLLMNHGRIDRDDPEIYVENIAA